MICIGGKSIAGEFAVNFRAARFRMFEFLDHHDSGAFAHDKTVAVSIPRARRALRLVIARAERFHCRKAGQDRSGTIDASEPPARKMSASPNLIMRQDSPMALFEVAQAVTMQRFGPRNPNSIEMKPLAMLLISIGMVKGGNAGRPFVH